MLYAKVDEESRARLEQELKAAKDAKWYRRVKIIHLSSQGKPVSELAAEFDLSRATVRDYLKRYNQAGLEGLKRKYSPGRPWKIKFSKAVWEELLHRSPCQFEKLNTAARNWTQALLGRYFAVYHGIEVAQSTLSSLLKRIGFRWNRGKLKVTSPDPLYTVKRERVETLKKKACKAP
jgi:transposase